MKRKWSILALILALVLVGCGQEAGSELNADQDSGKADSVQTKSESDPSSGGESQDNNELNKAEGQALDGESAEKVGVYVGDRHTLAMKADGTLWAWGSNDSGQLGTGKVTLYGEMGDLYPVDGIQPAEEALEDHDESAPVLVFENVIDAAAGDSSSYAVTRDHELYAWGSNVYLQLGIEGKENQSTPVKIMDDVVDVEAGMYQAVALKEDGSLWFFGYEPLETTMDENGDIVRPLTLPKKVFENVKMADVDSGGVMALTEENELYMWGSSNFMGYDYSDIQNTYVESPVKVMENVALISCKGQVNMVVNLEGELSAWGFDGSTGTLGTGTDEFYVKTPMHVMDDIAFISESCAISNSGLVYAWGVLEDSFITLANEGVVGGQLLDTIVEYGEVPKKIFEGGKYIARSDRMYVIDDNNVLWGAGANQFGKLGIGLKTAYVVDIQDDGEYSSPYYSVKEGEERFPELVEIMSLN